MENTYTQNWPAYDKAQTTEKLVFLRLLSDLTDLIETKRTKRVGRPRLELRDMAYCCALKVYSTFSGRRVMSDIQLAQDKGFVSVKPHYTTVLNYFDESELEHALKYLIRVSSLPLKEVEDSFAVDASGFSTSLFERWFNVRARKHSLKRQWRKAHLMCGVKTNVVTGVEVTPGIAGDSPEFPSLVQRTAASFDVKEVSADLAYSSRKNLQAVEDVGGVPFIPFKKSAKGKKRGFNAWRRMWLYFNSYQDLFWQHYHKRSNVETAFHMIKRKFGNHVSSRKPQAQDNEILCKVLCHNICVLIQEVNELGIKTDFSAKDAPTEKLITTD